jgi:type II secretory pathway pseudopilin PulG
MSRVTRSRAGFSVIEALVALSIAAIGLTAVLALQHQLVVDQQRYETVLRRVALRRSAMAIVADLNPELRPSGRTELGPQVTLSWSSEAETPLRRNTGIPVGDGAFDVRLYAVTASISDRTGSVIDRFTVERLGWKRLPLPTEA